MASLDSGLEMISVTEWQILEEIIKICKPFEELTKILSGELYPTLLSIIPLVRGLQRVLQLQEPLHKPTQQLRQCLIDAVNKRLASYEASNIPAKATFVDPRFKKLAFGNEHPADKAEKRVNEEVQALIAQTFHCGLILRKRFAT